MHFTIRLPDDTRPESHRHLRAQAAEHPVAARRGGSHLGGPPTRSGPVGFDRAGQAEHYAEAFPEVYKQAVSPDDAIAHIAIIEELQDDSVKLVFAEDDDGEERTAQLTWFLGGQSASLSQLLPMLQSMGVIVLEERPFTLERADGLQVWIYQFKIALHPTIPEPPEDSDADETAQRFADAVTAIWRGQAEIDRFNELVLRAGMTWQQVVIVRAYAKYLRQAGFPYSQPHIEAVVNDNPHTVRSLVELFEALFDPSDSIKRDAQAAAAAVAKDIDALVSLDTDRVMRAFASLVQATLRTNYFVTREGSARQQGVLSLKLDPGLIDELPLPRPKFEIFVHSPRVEGVHLRFGPVARGGLRWSDRREDFRTEILGLVKAQAVKNAVIVPVGAKGGFVVKQPPMATGDAGCRPRGHPRRGRRLLQDVHRRPARRDRQRRPLVREDHVSRTEWCAATTTTRTSSSPPTRAPRRFRTSPTRSPSPTASGWATRSRRVARSATTTRRWASRPAVPGRP